VIVANPRLFLLSPADCAGARARVLCRANADFPLARAVQRGEAPLGDVFSFLSGLYFRGKLTYASCFGTSPPLIITSADGLRTPECPVASGDLARWAATPVALDSFAYRQALTRDAKRLAASRPAGATVVLLGSLATPRYLAILEPIFTTALRVPRELIGRGDMSRGAILLRAVRDQRELEYVPAAQLPARRAARSAA
jgi:hypothetical protein